jgi:hypothetical protein
MLYSLRTRLPPAICISEGCTLGLVGSTPQPQTARLVGQHPNFESYADRATCHQKAAATAAKMDSSGTIQADPSETPVQPAPAKAASNPRGLRMTRDRSPDQLQFQPTP